MCVCLCICVAVNDYLNIEKSSKHNMTQLAWVFMQETATAMCSGVGGASSGRGNNFLRRKCKKIALKMYINITFVNLCQTKYICNIPFINILINYMFNIFPFKALAIKKIGILQFDV